MSDYKGKNSMPWTRSFNVVKKVPKEVNFGV